MRSVVRRAPPGAAGRARRPSARADVVLVQNAATARRLAGLATAPTSVLPNALCARVEAVPVAGPRRADVAVVGRVVAWKAVPLAVRVLAALPDPTVVLRVYGEVGGAEQERVQRVARDLGVTDRVQLVGKLPREELLGQVATSGVVLHPSLHDEAPFTVAEALALGTPVVGLDHGGPPHVAAAWSGGAPSAFVRPGRRGRTVARLAAAVEALRDPARPVATSPTAPTVDFGSALLAAYVDAAAAAAAARRA